MIVLYKNNGGYSISNKKSLRGDFGETFRSFKPCRLNYKMLITKESTFNMNLPVTKGLLGNSRLQWLLVQQ